MKLRIFLAALASIIVVAGCQSPAPTGGGTSLTPPPPVTKTPEAQTPPKDGTDTPPHTPAKPSPTPVIPETLKTDAYHWYGLSNVNEMNLQVTVEGQPPFTGTQQVRFREMKNGKAIFEINRTGAVGSQLGSETIALSKDGAYTIQSTQFTKSTNNLEMPSKLTPGTTWTNGGKFKMTTGQSLEQNEKFKVVGPQKVTTDVGTQDALLITSKGQVTLQGVKYRMESSFWYVKDKGLVKSVLHLTDLKDKKAQAKTITIQETK